MEFRLVFTGSMKSGQGHGVVEEKHAIRKSIHKQLAKLWQVVPDLKMRSEAHAILSAPPTRGTPGQAGFTVTMAAATHRESLWKTLGGSFDRWGYKFMPLVSKHLNLTCGLDVLLLQRDGASPLRRAVDGTDIDNRLKTLFDALQIPQNCQEIPAGAKETDEEPYFFCLVEDDCLVTDVKVTTDRWLAPYTPPPGSGAAHPENFVHAVITVRVHPSVFSFENLAFVT
jgi:hypothetical protein